MIHSARLLALALGLSGLAASPAVAKRAANSGAAVDSTVAAKTATPEVVAPPEGAPAVSGAVSELTSWVIASQDNHGLPFIVVEKVGAQVLAFDSDGQLVSATPALLGLQRGDDSAPGVGNRKLSAIGPDERTTPAGRFVARIGLESGGHQVLWIDYSSAISLHPVVTSNPKERRLQRLTSATAKDNRITYGCINVPAKFYAEVVRPLFTKSGGLVYILPETKPLNQVFLAYQPSPFASAMIR